MKHGYLYIIRSTLFEKNVYKLGYTEHTRKSLLSRYKTYYSNSVNIEGYYYIQNKNLGERLLFHVLRKYRVDHEFFKCDLDYIKEKCQYVVHLINSDDDANEIADNDLDIATEPVNDETTYESNSLKKAPHIDRPSEEPVEQCDVNGAKDISEASVGKEVSKKTYKIFKKPLKSYKCPQCQKTFSQKGHYDYHTKMRKNKCIDEEIINLKEGTENALNNNNKKKLKCKYCEKLFTRKDNLVVHLKMYCRAKKFMNDYNIKEKKPLY